MALRVLFASYTSEITGPTNSLQLLLRHLGPDYEPSVLMPKRGPLAAELEKRGVSVHSLPALDRWAIPDIVRLLRRNRIQLVYLNSTTGAMRNTAIAAILARVPYVCHVREMGHGKRWKRLGYLWPATSVVAVSEACANSVQRFVRRGRLHVVHNGVELDRSNDPPDRDHIRELCEIPLDAPVVLSVSHLAPRKGQEHAIAAMVAIREKHPSAHFCSIGALDRYPEYVERLKAQVRENGLEDRVHFLGFRRDLQRIYGGVDVFLHTALADPHPRSVIEAMSAGLPVVAFDTDGVTETVVDGQTGFIAPKGDAAALASALDRLLGDPAARAAMGAAGRQRVVEQFSAAGAAARIDRIIRSIGVRPRDPSPDRQPGETRFNRSHA